MLATVLLYIALLCLAMDMEFLIFPRLLSWMGVGFCQMLSQHLTRGSCGFCLEFVYILDYVDGFPYIEPSLHPWNETYLVRMDDCFDVFLDSVSKNFIEDFCIDIDKGN